MSIEKLKKMVANYEKKYKLVAKASIIDCCDYGCGKPAPGYMP